MTALEKTGEFNLIHRFQRIIPRGTYPPIIASIGDDAAVYEPTLGLSHVITTDAFIEGHHFDFRFYTMKDVGYKAMAVNLSDIASMNARPILATVALGIPGSVSLESLELLYEGLVEVASTYGVQIVGGDTTRAPVLTLSITVVGEASKSAIIYRNGAKLGEKICVTGVVGEAAMGLDILQHDVDPSSIGHEVFQHLTSRHLRPVPRFDFVKELNKAGVQPSSMIDISDGLSSELHHICNASQCGAVLWESYIPIPDDCATQIKSPRLPIDYGLNGGDDYELLFTASSEVLERISSDLYTEIGEVAQHDILIRRVDGTLESLKAEGHDHFR
ncbi:MAG: thiamine-phosphate kinase [Bacteroidetes bacterium]|nr:thiamine-phosphate kinase [Bacteroidota bacterium]